MTAGSARRLAVAGACVVAAATSGTAAALEVVQESWKLPLAVLCALFGGAGPWVALGRPFWRGRIARPDMLPERLLTFRGRAEEIAALRERHRAQAERAGSGTPRMLFIHGGPGIGKTALANELAYQLRGEYPDGHLHGNLGRAADRREPREILQSFVVELGEEAERAGRLTLSALQALFRSMTAKRRILIVLDAARDAAQVEDLLPNSGLCAVVVTSRGNLGSLLSHRSLQLKTPTMADATEILLAYAEPEDTADADCAAEVAELCERLPLALRASGDAARTGGGLNQVRAQLKSSSADRLARLKSYRRDVTEGYRVELSRLGVREQQAFRLLSVVKAETFAPWVLQPLFAAIDQEVTTEEAGNILAALSTVGLLLPVEKQSFPRYRFPPFGRLLADQLLPAAMGERGILPSATDPRIRTDFLRTVLTMACEVMDGGRRNALPRPEVQPSAIPRRDLWLTPVQENQEYWRRMEHTNLLNAALFARDHGYPEACRQLLTRIGGVMGAPVALDEFAGCVEQVIDSAPDGDVAGLRLALMSHAAVVEDHVRALAECDALMSLPPHPRTQARALLLKGQTLQQIGKYKEAAEALRESRLAAGSTSTTMVERAAGALLAENDAVLDPGAWRTSGPTEGDPVREGADVYLAALIWLLNGRCAARRDDFGRMEESLARAEGFTSGDLVWDAAVACERVQHQLDRCHADQSQLRAVADISRARLSYQAMGNVPGQARALILLARLLLGRGDAAGCARRIEQARVLLRARHGGLPISAALERVGGDLALEQGKPEEAKSRFELALRQYEEMGEFWYGACVRVGLAESEKGLGHIDRAIELLWKAGALFASCGDKKWLSRTKERLDELAPPALVLLPWLDARDRGSP
ncbi:AAA family ATPase [Nonomuraea sp. NPDC049709]|uniref:AAA family ATPase n=1 Tax=Nonomuraea sp. NPDC049709 TaxID=3154736 RepID=UPI0034207DB4